MQWKFWKRRNKADWHLDEREKTPTESGEPPKDKGPSLNARSATELLGLQRLVGNQAVLQMVRVRPADEPDGTGLRTTRI